MSKYGDYPWITKDGTEMTISEMTNNHLFNAMNWAKRRADEFESAAMDMYGYAFDGRTPDGASMLAESEANSAEQQAETLRFYAHAFEHELTERETKKWKDEKQP